MIRTPLGLALLLSFTTSGSASTDLATTDRIARELSLPATLAGASLQELVLPPASQWERFGPAPFEVALRIEGAEVLLVLEPHSVLAPDFELLVQQADGALVPVPAGPATTYRGHALGWPQSRVAASFHQGRLEALVHLDASRPLYGVQSVAAITGAPSASHVVYSMANALPPGGTCGVPDGIGQAHGGGGTGEGAPAPEGGPALKVCQIACDADVEFFNQNGSSVDQTKSDIETIVNACEAIYEADAGILYSITRILVRTSEQDPYDATDPGVLLGQFQQHWNNNQQGTHRDVAHLFTGKNLDGSVIGVAQLGTVCSTFLAYGLSQSKYTGNLVFRTGLTAHELGHNWNAGHCNGDSDCWIMCSGIGGCSGSVTKFGTSSKSSIVNKKNAVLCLSDPAGPTLSGLSPAGVDSLAGAEVTLIGSDFSGATKVSVGGTDLLPGSFTIVNDARITFAPPDASALGGAPVSVWNVFGASSALTLTYVAPQPPKMVVPAAAQAGQPFPWRYAGDAAALAFLLADTDPLTAPLLGLDLLVGATTLKTSLLDAAGIGSFTFPLPAPGAVWTLYSQVLTFDGVSFEASAFPQTLVFP